MIHRRSLTYIDELIKDDFFGELAFFSEKPRRTTVKSRDFTDCFILDRWAFLDKAESYEDVLSLYWKINNAINDENDSS